MSEHLTFYVDNRNPPIQETITIGGVAVDLSTSSVRFKMRPIGSETLKVDQPAVFATDGTDGRVLYQWLGADVDTAGEFLIWWEVTTASKTQDMGEALIVFLEHAPGEHLYVELEDWKSTLELSGTSFVDMDARRALEAASRAVDHATGTRFYTTATDETRYFTAGRYDSYINIGDLNDLTSVAVDINGDATWAQTWVEDTDFLLTPLNAPLDGMPWTRISLMMSSSWVTIGDRYFPWHSRGIRVVGKFGWPTLPAEIEMATSILASKLVKRSREAPFGVVAFGQEGQALRIARQDPDVASLLAPYTRTLLLV